MMFAAAMVAVVAGTTCSAFADEPPPRSDLAGLRGLCELPAAALRPRAGALDAKFFKYSVGRVVVQYGGAPDQRPAGLPPEEDLGCIRVRLAQRADGVFVDPFLPGAAQECAISDLFGGQNAVVDGSAINALKDQVRNALNRLGVVGVITVPAQEPTRIEEEGAPAQPAAAPAVPAEKPPEGKKDTKESSEAGAAAGEAKSADAEKTAEVKAASAAPSADIKAADSTLRLVVYVGAVQEVRTVAMTGGEASQRINLDRHKTVRLESPVQPPMADAQGRRQSEYVNLDALDDYVLRLNRHPGRRVDLAISPYGDYADAKNDAQVTLDYLISEPERPWSVYAQVSNTGTGDTGHWRERFGYTNTNLTGNDDILRVDYLTSSFDKLHNISGSYEFPIADRWRIRAFGTYSRFTASDVGFQGRDFEGESGEVGAEVLYNFFQSRDWFADAFLGARYQDVYTADPLVGSVGDTNFFYPFFGATIQRDNEQSSTSVTASVEFQTPWVGTNGDDAIRLGRQPVDTSWTTFKFDAEHSFYLEPLLFPATFAGEGLNGNKWQPGMTLAHEVSVALRAQYTFDDRRVIPNAQAVMGGLYSVRGYPEAVAVGDNSIVGTLEYRLHIPRLFRPVEADSDLKGADGRAIVPEFSRAGDFRWRPEQRYGRADWDLIVKAFVDAGATYNNDRQEFSERDQTLVGAGIGAEAQFSHRDFRASLRVDWGFALEELQDAANRVIVEEGSSRVHCSLTILF